MTVYRFAALTANQADEHDVFVFAAEPRQILEFARIERVGRKDNGELRGFQRHRTPLRNIKEIRDYLGREDALLPNAVVVAFLGGVVLHRHNDGCLDVTIDTKDGSPGILVDGQQRLTALSGLNKPGFQVFVSAIICKNYDEIRQQFVFINSVRPLPKALIYELLPNLEGMSERYTMSRFSARVVERLNFYGGPALRGQIQHYTNPEGVISNAAMRKLIMNSATEGAVRDLLIYQDYEDRAFALIDNFFTAVAKVFTNEWVGMSPHHSRLRHSAGIAAIGFVMDLLYSHQRAATADQFEIGLNLLKPYTAWTSGNWPIPDYEVAWNHIQNTSHDIDVLARHMVLTIKRQLRKLCRVGIG